MVRQIFKPHREIRWLPIVFYRYIYCTYFVILEETQTGYNEHLELLSFGCEVAVAVTGSCTYRRSPGILTNPPQQVNGVH